MRGSDEVAGLRLETESRRPRTETVSEESHHEPTWERQSGEEKKSCGDTKGFAEPDARLATQALIHESPEFQRLFRTSQLGFADVVYPTANHTRGTHSIGACYITSLLIDQLQENAERLQGEDPKKDDDRPIRKIAVSFGKRGSVVTAEWGPGPEALRNDLHQLWYQPFRHDIIRNTLSADLIDCLARDPQRMGSKRRIDLHLLNYYVMVRQDIGSEKVAPTSAIGSPPQPDRNRCAIDPQDHKRGTVRVNVINDIFPLSDLRHEICEKAVLHRVVQAANAMLSRALLLMGDRRPTLAEIVNLGEDDHALQTEDSFSGVLLAKSEHRADSIVRQRQLNQARRILRTLADRPV